MSASGLPSSSTRRPTSRWLLSARETSGEGAGVAVLVCILLVGAVSLEVISEEGSGEKPCPEVS